MLMNTLLTQNAEEIFLLLLKMKNMEVDYTAEHLLTLDASLKILGYLDNKVNGGSQMEYPDLIEIHTDLKQDDDLQNRINLIYNRLRKMVDSYEGTRH